MTPSWRPCATSPSSRGCSPSRSSPRTKPQRSADMDLMWKSDFQHFVARHLVAPQRAPKPRPASPWEAVEGLLAAVHEGEPGSRRTRRVLDHVRGVLGADAAFVLSLPDGDLVEFAGALSR